MAASAVAGVNVQVVPVTWASPSNVVVRPTVENTLRVSPLRRLSDSVPLRVGVLSSVAAPAAIGPVLRFALSLIRLIVAVRVGAVASSTMERGAERLPWLPAASTTAAVKTTEPLLLSEVVGVKVQLVVVTVALPR